MARALACYFYEASFTNPIFTVTVYKYMSTSQNDSGDKPVPPTKSTVVLLLGTIADTTWRMFIPTIGLTIAGVYSDKAFSLKPWLTIAGIILGSTIAGLLVARQLKKVNK
jgi:hypothetical protein